MVVSDSTPTGDAGASHVTRSGYAVSYVDTHSADKGTLAHEMAHQFAGDTTGVLNSIVRQDPTGIVGAFANTLADLANDTGRALTPVNAADPHIGPG